MSEIRYSKDHEYIRVEGGEGVVGISDYAQQQLGDVVFAETPPVGKALKKGDPAAVVESVKAASDVFAPASGEVLAVNSEVESTPGLINEDALGRGWLFRIVLAGASELSALMDEAGYADFLKTLAESRALSAARRKRTRGHAFPRRGSGHRSFVRRHSGRQTDTR